MRSVSSEETRPRPRVCSEPLHLGGHLFRTESQSRRAGQRARAAPGSPSLSRLSRLPSGRTRALTRGPKASGPGRVAGGAPGLSPPRRRAKRQGRAGSLRGQCFSKRNSQSFALSHVLGKICVAGSLTKRLLCFAGSGPGPPGLGLGGRPSRLQPAATGVYEVPLRSGPHAGPILQTEETASQSGEETSSSKHSRSSESGRRRRPAGAREAEGRRGRSLRVAAGGRQAGKERSEQDRRACGAFRQVSRAWLSGESAPTSWVKTSV